MSRTSLLLALAVVLAGCTGLPATESNDTTTPSDATALGPAPDRAVLQRAHAERLRTAGSFTYEERTVIRSDETELRAVERRVVRMDLDTGRALRQRVTAANKTLTTYRTANGTLYEQTQLATGKTSYHPPAGNLTAERFLQPDVLAVFGNATLDHRTNGSRHVYEASGVDALANASDSFDVPTENLTRFSFRGVVTDDGLFRSYNLTFGLRREGTTYTVTVAGEFSAVGETTVSEPAWLSEARAARERRESRPDPGDYVEMTADRPELGVSVSVYARADSLSEPELRERAHWYTEFLNQSRAGPVVQVYWPEETRNGTVTFRYDEGMVPNGNESALRVVQYDRDRQVFVPVETTVDARRNVARADLDEQGIYSLFHYRVYLEALGAS